MGHEWPNSLRNLKGFEKTKGIGTKCGKIFFGICTKDKSQERPCVKVFIKGQNILRICVKIYQKLLKEFSSEIYKNFQGVH